MKTFAFAILILFLASGVPGRAADAPDVTVEVTLVAMPAVQAMQLISRYDAQGAAVDEFKEVLAMVDKKSASRMAAPSVVIKSGQAGSVESAGTKLQVEAVKDPASDNVNMVVDLGYGKKRIATAIFIKSGDVKCIGALDLADVGDGGTCLVFVRMTIGK